MKCVPAVSALVEKVAVPPLRVPFPMVAAPSLKVTVLVGVPPAAPATVAVNVTLCPSPDGFGEDVNVVTDPPTFTTWISAGDVLAALPASPPYSAVMERDP